MIRQIRNAESADRPIPRDGLPAVGFLLPGLFCVVSHYGITLGPLLGGSLQLNCNCAIKQLQVNFSKTTDRQDLAAMHRLSWIKDSMYFLSTITYIT